MSSTKDSTTKDVGITRGTTNVFDDLGFPDAAERQTKTRMALAVNELLKVRKLKQREIAALLHIPQPRVSALKNYRLDQFSVERLMECLAAGFRLRSRPNSARLRRMQKPLSYRHRAITDDDLVFIRNLIAAHPESSRFARVRSG